MDKKCLLVLLLTFFALPFTINAATLSVSPVSSTYEVGERVTVRIVVSSTAPINAVSGIVSFPTDIFAIESISKAGSILNFWVTEPNFSQGAGTLQFEGVALGGYSGGTGTVVIATLRAVKTGSGSIYFKSAQILANDGQGTDITDGTTGATISVRAATLVPESLKPESLAPEVIEDALAQPAPTLDSPQIEYSSMYGEKAVSGASIYPKAQVLLTFVSSGGVKVFITGETDENGKFTLIVPKTLRRGEYTVSAVIIQKDFSNSHYSNTITIKAGSLVSDVGVGVTSLIGALFVLLVYLIIGSYKYLKKNKKLRIFVHSEAKEAENILHKSFEVLGDSVSSGSSRTSKAEVDRIKSIKKDLKDAEKIIAKEIEDIEKA